MLLTCSLLLRVARLASSEGFLGPSSPLQDSRLWAVLHSCSYCSENAGTWISVATLGECEAKCNTAESPYMVYKANAPNWPAWPTNCRCDASCNGQIAYPSCEGQVYHKDVSKVAKTVSQPTKHSAAADSNTVLIDDGSMTLSRDLVTQGQRLANDIHDKTRIEALLPENKPKVAVDSQEETDNQEAIAYEQLISSGWDLQDDVQDDSSSIDADVDKLQDSVNELHEQLTHPDNLYEPEYSNDLVLLQCQVSDIQDELLGELTKLKALSLTNQVLGARIHDVAVLQKVVKRIQDELTRRRYDRSKTNFLAKEVTSGPPSDVHTPEQAKPRSTEIIMVLLQRLTKHVTRFGNALRKDSLDHRRKAKHGTVRNSINP